MNYTKIKVVFKDYTDLDISEDEIVVYQLSGDYKYIEYQNDKEQTHRLDGPAIEWADGSTEWYVNGQTHRVDGPAIEWSDGSKEWYVKGQRHRVDGPAYEWANGSKEWYVNGKEYTKEEFERKFK